MTTSVNPTLTEAQKVFKALIWDPMVKAGETYIEGVAPVLALPVIKELDEATIQAVTDYAFSLVVRTIDVAAIRLLNSAHQTAFDNASLQLKIVAVESGVNSSEYSQALDAAAIALSRFTRFGT